MALHEWFAIAPRVVFPSYQTTRQKKENTKQLDVFVFFPQALEAIWF